MPCISAIWRIVYGLLNSKTSVRNVFGGGMRGRSDPVGRWSYGIHSLARRGAGRDLSSARR
jgi:hypothetical protein